jgi:hypothetical protein
MKVKQLNIPHPSWDGHRLGRLRALMEGGPAWHALKKTWFPQRPVEPADIYDERVSLLTYVNHAGGILTTLCSFLFSEAPQIGGIEGDYWSRLQENCDGGGTPWRRFWLTLLADALVGRQSFLWANLPDRGNAAYSSRADEEKAGALDAWLIELCPEMVYNWEEDKQGRLSWILFRSILDEQPSIDKPREKVWRWTHIDATHIRRFEWRPTMEKSAPNDEDEVKELPSIAHGVGRIPVIRLQLPGALWGMSRLEDAAVASCRSRNELSWALHQAANELLCVTSKWGDEKIALGHGHYLRLSRDEHGEDHAAFVAPSGVAFQFLQQDVQDTREEVYRVLQQMAQAADSDANRARMSGASKSQDWKAHEILLSAFADIVKGAMREAVELLMGIRGETASDLTISGLDGWQSEDLLTFLEAAGLATEARALSPTFRKAVAKRQALRLLQDEVSSKELAAIEKEIEESDPESLDPLSGYGAPRKPTGDSEDDAPPAE